MKAIAEWRMNGQPFSRQSLEVKTDDPINTAFTFRADIPAGIVGTQNDALTVEVSFKHD